MDVIEDKAATIGVVGAAAGAVLGLLFPFILNYINTKRANKAADRKDALEEVYRLYSEVKLDRDGMRDKLTASLVECERRRGIILRTHETACHIRKLLVAKGMKPENIPEVEDVSDLSN